MSGRLSRREFVRITALTAVGGLAAACAPTAGPSAPPAEPVSGAPAAPAAPSGARYAESPLLAGQVQAGALPPVDERVPDEPMIVGPGVLIPESMLDWKVGQFGGTMRYVTPTTSVCADLWDANAEPPLISPGKLVPASMADIKANVLKGYELSEDLTTFTFYMRKGVKWSDGQPCTTADVQFWYEDVLLNEEITPTPPKIFKSGNRVDGTLMQLEVVDDYTFRFIYDEPCRAIVAHLAAYAQNWSRIMRPAHYMKQFHKKYADMDVLKPLLVAASLPEEEWWRYYNQREEGARAWDNLLNVDPAYPMLNPWILESMGPNVKTYVRNPYFWKVDTAGNQLPYIDRINVEMVSSIDAVTMKILAGEVDFHRHYASTQNIPLYKENEERGDFHVQILDAHTAMLQFRLNYTHPDENWRKTVRDVRFRKALNMAIDHKRVVEIVCQGFAAEPDVIGLPYDSEGAGKLLDEMGMDKRDADGFRLGLDGNPFVFPLEVEQDLMAEQDALCELLVEYWQDIGVKTDWRKVERTLYITRADANELYIRMGWAHTGYWRDAPTTSDFLPDASRLWQLWNTTGGKDGEEPDLPWAKRLYEIANTADAYVMTETETKALHEELFQILRDEVPTIIPVDYSVYPLPVSNRLGNVPTSGQGIVAAFTQDQFFFKQ